MTLSDYRVRTHQQLVVLLPSNFIVICKRHYKSSRVVLLVMLIKTYQHNHITMTMHNTFGGIKDLTTNPTTAPTCFLMMSVTLVQILRVNAPDHRPDLTCIAKTNAQLNSCSYTCESIPLHRFHTYCLHSRKAAQDNTD